VSGKSQGLTAKNLIIRHGGIERMDTSTKTIYLSFTGHDFNDGGKVIRQTLKDKKVKAHFFFTGDFYRASVNRRLIRRLKRQGHYLGAHSDKHLLYASWNDRDALLVTKEEFKNDLLDNYAEMERFRIKKSEARFFMPPYEWYNRKISQWTKELGFTLVNYTSGTRSNADYTTPDMGTRYVSSETIFQKILTYEESSSCGLNGFILLIHIGTHPDRKDKLYNRLPELIDILKNRGYNFSLLSP
jgi:peptidoglycan/xylan/chitin deacetylase (PgdA/CDA1 family)